jgi:hypothetical protein
VDVGESLVAAYMRQVRGAHTVALNTYLPWGQGELDIVAVAIPEGDGSPPRVWLAEVAVHLDGLDYGGYPKTVAKVTQKAATATRYAKEVYPEADYSVELWSPVVPRGLVTALAGCGADLVVNDDFTARVGELLELARKGTRRTTDPAFRLLQILTHLRGAKHLHLA